MRMVILFLCIIMLLGGAELLYLDLLVKRLVTRSLQEQGIRSTLTARLDVVEKGVDTNHKAIMYGKK